MVAVYEAPGAKYPPGRPLLQNKFRQMCDSFLFLGWTEVPVCNSTGDDKIGRICMQLSAITIKLKQLQNRTVGMFVDNH
jgi:hypothetical protein